MTLTKFTLPRGGAITIRDTDTQGKIEINNEPIPKLTQIAPNNQLWYSTHPDGTLDTRYQASKNNNDLTLFCNGKQITIKDYFLQAQFNGKSYTGVLNLELNNTEDKPTEPSQYHYYQGDQRALINGIETNFDIKPNNKYYNTYDWTSTHWQRDGRLAGGTDAPGFDDIIHGSDNEQDWIEGLDGDDALEGRNGDDHLYGGNGDDLLAGGRGHDHIEGGSGDDFIWGSAYFLTKLARNKDGEHISAQYPANTKWIKASAAWGIYQSTSGSRIYTSIKGIHNNKGEDERKKLYGNSGNDTIFGGWDNDTIYGDDETEKSTDGVDELWGLAGSDHIDGGGGDDIIWGDGQSLRNSAGSLSLSYTPAEQHGNDFLSGGSGDDQIIGQGADDTIWGGEGNDLILGDDETEDLEAKYHGNDTIWAGSGDDRIEGGGGGDRIWGGEGNDQIWGDLDGDDNKRNNPHHAGDDHIWGEDGNDTIWAGGGNDHIEGGTGDDEISGDDGNDYLEGNEGDDKLYGGRGNDELIGGNGNDELHGNEGDDHLYGGAGNDFLNDAFGNNTLDGGAGNDELVLNGGNSFYTGGSGDDTFYLFRPQTGIQTITDFSIGDGLYLCDSRLSDYHLEKRGNDLVLMIDPEDNSNQIIVKNYWQWQNTSAPPLIAEYTNPYHGFSPYGILKLIEKQNQSSNGTEAGAIGEGNRESGNSASNKGEEDNNNEQNEDKLPETTPPQSGTTENKEPGIGETIETQLIAFIGEAFYYKLPENAFIDPDGDILLLSVSSTVSIFSDAAGDKTLIQKEDGTWEEIIIAWQYQPSETIVLSGLPDWLQFDAETGTFSGTPSATDSWRSISITIHAHDPISGGTSEQQFDLIVQSKQPPALGSTGGNSDADNNTNIELGHTKEQHHFTAEHSGTTVSIGSYTNTSGNYTYSHAYTSAHTMQPFNQNDAPLSTLSRDGIADEDYFDLFYFDGAQSTNAQYARDGWDLIINAYGSSEVRFKNFFYSEINDHPSWRVYTYKFIFTDKTLDAVDIAKMPHLLPVINTSYNTEENRLFAWTLGGTVNGTNKDEILTGQYGTVELNGGGGNDYLRATSAEHAIFIGGTGDDEIDSSEYRNTYYFGKGMGQDIINQYNGAHPDENGHDLYPDTLIFTDVSSTELWVWREDNDLILGILGLSDTVRIRGGLNEAYNGTDEAIEQFQFIDGTMDWQTLLSQFAAQLAAENTGGADSNGSGSLNPGQTNPPSTVEPPENGNDESTHWHTPPTSGGGGGDDGVTVYPVNPGDLDSSHATVINPPDTGKPEAEQTPDNSNTSGGSNNLVNPPNGWTSSSGSGGSVGAGGSSNGSGGGSGHWSDDWPDGITGIQTDPSDPNHRFPDRTDDGILLPPGFGKRSYLASYSSDVFCSNPIDEYNNLYSPLGMIG